MSVSIQQIDAWLTSPTETPQLEFKLASNSFDKERLLQYCVAIANEGGGHLVLGVTDKHPRKVAGTNAFLNTTKCAQEVFDSLKFRVDVHEVNHPAGRVLVFEIPSRPRGTAYGYKGSYFMRSGEALIPMSEDKLRAIFLEGQPDWSDEIARRELAAEEIVELLDTQTFFELLKRPYPTTQNAVVEKLASDRLVVAGGGGYSITNVCALLLAKNLAAFGHLTRKAPRVIVYTGTSKLSPRIDRTGARGYAVGFQSLVSFVMGQLPQNEIIQNALRRSVTLLPEDSVRELIANALIHQDLTAAGPGPMIEIYSNRVEISNPGEPIIPVDRFIDGYRSRNERMADLMRQMDICEERSSGVDRVVSNIEMFQLPAPEFISALGRTIVVAHGPRRFDDMTREDKIRACYQHCVLRYVLRERMTNETLRERFGLPKSKSSTISQIIAATVDAGRIKADETVGASKKYARYLPGWA